MMDKLFIDKLRVYKVDVEYQWSCAGDKEYESYILRDENFNRLLTLNKDKKGYRLVFLEQSDKLNNFDNDVTFKILEIIKNKMN